MDPAAMGGAQGMGAGVPNMTRGPRDRLIGVAVTIVRGPNKGIAGIIKDTNAGLARVELATSRKVVNVDIKYLYRRL